MSQIMEGFGSDSKQPQEYERLPTELDLEQDVHGRITDEPTQLEEYIDSGRCRRHFCCCLTTSKSFLWALFVVLMIGNALITSNHIYQDDQFALRDERDIARLNHQVHQLQQNQAVIIRTLLDLSHDSDSSQELRDIMGKIEGLKVIDATSCLSQPDNPLCKQPIVQ